MTYSFGKFHIELRKVWSAAVFFFLWFYMLVPANLEFLNELRDSFYICAVPVLLAAVLYFRRLRDGTELKLLFAFWIWFWFSRALNGSPTLDHDFRIFFDLSLMIPFFALGPALTNAEKKRFLDWLSAIIGGFYFIIGLIALSAFLRRSLYMLPIAEAQIGIVPNADYSRIIILDDNPTITSFWYLIALFLMIYQFFQCEKKLWRVPILFSALLDLSVIAICYSRSVWLCAALAFALLTVMLLLQFLQTKSRFLRLAVAFFAAVLVLSVSYKSCALCADMMTTLSYKIGDSKTSQVTEQGPGPENAIWTEDRFSIRPMVLSSGKTQTPQAVNLPRAQELSDPQTASGDLNYVSFSRRQIWHGALQTIRMNPSILWRGHICDSVIIAAYSFITDDGTGQIPWNFYNSLIQVLMTTGLPGLFLVISFLVLILYRGIRFSLCVKAPLSLRTLVLPVAATIPYFMLEAGLFSAIDVRTLFYYLMCGMMLGASREYTVL